MRKGESLLVQPIGFEYAVEHAAGELVKYLPQIAPVTVGALPVLGSLPKETPARIVVGTSRSLAGAGIGPLPKASILKFPAVWAPAGAVPHTNRNRASAAPEQTVFVNMRTIRFIMVFYSLQGSSPRERFYGP